MSFLFEYSGFPRRPVPGDPGPFPRFRARLAEADVLLAWGVADDRDATRGSGRRADGPGRAPSDDPRS